MREYKGDLGWGAVRDLDVKDLELWLCMAGNLT